MYILFPIVFLLLLLFLVLCHFKKKQVIQKICSMTFCEKCCLLDLLAEPFGFRYDPEWDLFTSLKDAWQKKFGYRRAFDYAAPSMNMVFDSEPVYFNYRHQTWLIQFWKGQYGINTGAEVGIYRADSIVPPSLREQTLFHAVDECEMLPVKLCLSTEDCTLFCHCAQHWWLTGFRMGAFHAPGQLKAEITLTFPDAEMSASFLRSLYALGYRCHEISVSQTTVKIPFDRPKSSLPPCRGCQSYALWKMRMLCRIYLWATKPFCRTVDRLLYLYFFVPHSFRRLLRIRRFEKHSRQKRKSGRRSMVL